mmetsp:Transcript_26127/g.73328  ORF Transcript_26127/g.73328 Transcript_26127/m.73328 type:complete len:144 (-) Transcript_26127:37-468(-)
MIALVVVKRKSREPKMANATSTICPAKPGLHNLMWDKVGKMNASGTQHRDPINAISAWICLAPAIATAVHNSTKSVRRPFLDHVRAKLRWVSPSSFASSVIEAGNRNNGMFNKDANANASGTTLPTKEPDGKFKVIVVFVPDP